jgi:hypothetical protein
VEEEKRFGGRVNCEGESERSELKPIAIPLGCSALARTSTAVRCTSPYIAFDKLSSFYPPGYLASLMLKLFSFSHYPR